MSYFVVRRVASHDEMEIIGAGGSPVEVAPIALAARQRGDWVRVYESPIGAQAMRLQLVALCSNNPRLRVADRRAGDAPGRAGVSGGALQPEVRRSANPGRRLAGHGHPDRVPAFGGSNRAEPA